jgi:hypothetical protein
MHAGTQNPKKYIQPRRKSCLTPLGKGAFIVNSEPHFGARPSVHLCVGLNTNFKILSLNLIPEQEEYSNSFMVLSFFTRDSSRL